LFRTGWRSAVRVGRADLRERLTGLVGGPMFRLLLAVALMNAAGNIFSSVLPDYLHNVLRVGGETRGALEFPRELPGFLQVFLLGLMAGISTSRAIVLSFLMGAAAFAGLSLGVIPFPAFVALMMLYSAGMHLYGPLRDALAMELVAGGRRGRVLGDIGAFRSVGLILGTGLVWLAMTFLNTGYSGAYAAACVCMVLGMLASAGVREPRKADGTGGEVRPRRRRLVFRRRYVLYYILAVLFGARKQIFLTFAPWLLVSCFQQKAPQLAVAMGISAVLGLFSKPMFGNLIDKFGERTVLTGESILVFLLCLGYSAAPELLPAGTAVLVLYALYVTDELLFSLSMARTTYLSRIVLSREDMVPTLGLGGTMDHLVSMLIPAGAGLLWVLVGPWSVFMLAALLALVNLAFVRRMPAHFIADSAQDTGDREPM
jgi:MFS family permease